MDSFGIYKNEKQKIDKIISQLNVTFDVLEELKEYIQSNETERKEYIAVIEEFLITLVRIYEQNELINKDDKLLSLLSEVSYSLQNGQYGDLSKRILEFDFRRTYLLLYNTLMNKIRTFACNVSNAEWEKENREYIKEIVEYINGNYDDQTNPHHDELMYIVKNNELMSFPYGFEANYEENTIEVYNDVLSGYKYVIHNGKRLYFPYSVDSMVRHAYYSLLIEQDPESPHCYFMDKGQMDENTIFVDVGASEGIASLDVVDFVKEVYLIECDTKWIKALQLTFREYEEKVHIIPKYAGYVENDYTSTIDNMFSHYKNAKIFIKMDIEGMELEALESARSVMRDNICFLSCAIYHYDEAEDDLIRFFNRNNYKYEIGKGYMLVLGGRDILHNGYYKRPCNPYFRRCLVRATNEKD